MTFANAPDDLGALVGPLPADTRVVERGGEIELALLFVKQAAELRAEFGPLATLLVPKGMLWVAWPKRASKFPTDLDENIVREIGLEAGLVDVKVCAINDFWSGLKFVRRLASRAPA